MQHFPLFFVLAIFMLSSWPPYSRNNKTQDNCLDCLLSKFRLKGTVSRKPGWMVSDWSAPDSLNLPGILIMSSIETGDTAVELFNFILGRAEISRSVKLVITETPGFISPFDELDRSTGFLSILLIPSAHSSPILLKADPPEVLDQISMNFFGSSVLQLLFPSDFFSSFGVVFAVSPTASITNLAETILSVSTAGTNRSDATIFIGRFLRYGRDSTSFWIGTLLCEIVVAWIIFIQKPNFMTLLVLGTSWFAAVFGAAVGRYCCFQGVMAFGFWFLFIFPFNKFLVVQSLRVSCLTILAFLLAVSTLTRSSASILLLIWVAGMILERIIFLAHRNFQVLSMTLGLAIPLAATFWLVSVSEMLADSPFFLGSLVWVGAIGMFPRFVRV